MPSKNTKKKIFKYTPSQTLPPIAVQENWDLTQYYTSETDPKLETDIKFAEQSFKKFAKKWRGTAFTSDVTLLKEALTESEAMAGNPHISRPGRYFNLRSSVNTADAVAEKHSALLRIRLRKASNETLFFPLELGKISKETQKLLLQSDELAHFRYYLEQLFAGAAHHLSEAEEKIISLKSGQSYSRWVDMTDKIITQRKVTWKGKSIALPEALEHLHIQPFADKPKLWNKILDEMEQIGEVAEHEFNAIITDVRTEDELRGYKKPYSATVMNYQDDEKSLERLVEVVSTDGFDLSRRFYKAKAAYHGVKALDYSQKSQSAGEEVAIPFPQAVEICRDVFYSVNNRYGEVFDTMLTQGQIDAWPKPGKSGGAFMSAQSGHPINVLLNHVSDFKSLETLAHEMGHAIHADRSRTQTPFYDGHSIVTAETASTLFENLVYDAVYAQVDAEQKLVLVHDRIMRDIATIQRQIAFFNAELEIHTIIHRDGAMTNHELRDCMRKHLASYLGDGVTVTERDGYSYVYVGHLRYGFYVYSYAEGLLMSSLMAARYRADKSYGAQIEKFLCSGESKLIKDIYKDVGINTQKPDTFKAALTNLTADITTFEKMVKKGKK